MTPEAIAALNDVATNSANLLAECIGLKNSVEARIAAAVLASENGAILPQITTATNLIDTQTLLVAYIAKG